MNVELRSLLSELVTDCYGMVHISTTRGTRKAREELPLLDRHIDVPEVQYGKRSGHFSFPTAQPDDESITMSI